MPFAKPFVWRGSLQVTDWNHRRPLHQGGGSSQRQVLTLKELKTGFEALCFHPKILHTRSHKRLGVLWWWIEPDHMSVVARWHGRWVWRCRCRAAQRKLARFLASVSEELRAWRARCSLGSAVKATGVGCSSPFPWAITAPAITNDFSWLSSNGVFVSWW